MNTTKLLRAAHALRDAGYGRSDIGTMLGNFYPEDRDEARHLKPLRRAWERRLESPGYCWAYLLEFSSDGGDTWAASEIDDGSGEGGDNNNYWECPRWYDDDLQIGWFAECPSAWLCSSCDWDGRLGVDFDARITPQERPSPVGIWGGVTNREIYGEEVLWRVRKVLLSCRLGDRQDEWVKAHPEVRWMPKEYIAGN